MSQPLSYQFISQFKATMNDQAKRSLRERRAPKQFGGEGEDPDPYGYSCHPFSRDLRTPSQQINQDAKLLVKFINHSNKSLRELEEDNRRKELTNIREPVAIRERKARIQEIGMDETRRGQQISSSRANDPSRKSKEPYNIKTASISERLLQKNDAFFNEIKTLSKESAQNMRFLEMACGKNRTAMPPLPSNQSKDKNNKLQGPPKSGQSSQKPGQFFFKDKEKVKKAQQLQNKLNLPQSDFSNSKVFKRASYHVAICYHIYLKKLAEKGPIGDIDPTAAARRLRDGMGKNN